MPECCTETVPLSLLPGRRYRFCGLRGKPRDDGTPRWAYPPSVYELIGVACDYRTGQDRVVYRGVANDHDRGKLHVCGYSDWALQFTLVEETEVQHA